jgi:SAM-dependent methyltransferase
MLYNVNGKTIKTENAAKSYKQPSHHLLDLLSTHRGNSTVMDYGCGKLRYLKPICNIAPNRIFVDSSRQLNRTQLIHEELTTVKLYLSKHVQNSLVIELESFSEVKFKVDFVLCSNVLSVIPENKEQENCVQNIKKSLNSNGKALFVCQYKNSYFDEYSIRDGAIKHLDGYIIPGRKDYSYYGIITPDKLRGILEKNNFMIIEEHIKCGSIYTLCK